MSLPRVLSVHNFYRHAGGEDAVFSSEASLLRARGHAVATFEDYNNRIRSSAATVLAALWNQAAYGKIGALADTHRADVVHFHNTFPLISPSAYYAARASGAAVVQTLHNYRLVCPGATLMRDGSPCEECITQRSFLPSIRHGCYQNSRAATASAAVMLTVHRATETWRRAVDLYIALSEFARHKYIQGGLPADRIVVKPNFLDCDPGPGQGNGGYALFVGRLSEEKGIRTLLSAWGRVSDLPLRVIGDGPIEISGCPDNVTLLGRQPHDRVLHYMREATLLIFPSIWYECSPMTLIEALACGLPVVASDIGSIPEFVRDGHTGRLFRAGDAEHLAATVRSAIKNSDDLAAMRVKARHDFETRYTSARNYDLLMAAYQRATANANFPLMRAS